MASSKRFSLLHSERRHPSGARRLSKKPDTDEILRVTVVLRPRSTAQARRDALRGVVTETTARRASLSAAEFTRLHGARLDDLERIKEFAAGHDLEVLDTNRPARCITLSGTIRAMARAFSVDFTTHRLTSETYRSYRDSIRIPGSLENIVEAVLGLDNRMLMRHHTFLHAHHAIRNVTAAEAARAYNFPESATGEGQCIAIIELGGGFYNSDMEEFFRRCKLPAPKIRFVEVDGQRNDPASRDSIKKMLDAMGVSPVTLSAQKETTDDDRARAIQALWTIETTLDVQLAGSFANAAEIIVYFAPNNAQGKYRAIAEALHSKQHPPNVICCSWGAVENDLPLDFVKSMDQLFQDAALKDVTICFSSGDRGDDPDQKGNPRAHFPASSPHVLACGGTHWVNDAPIEEVVWSEKLPTIVAQSGGGVSKLFDEPEWQSSAEINAKTGRSGRGVPDVAGKADMATGYWMLVGGYGVTMGGTSAAAPLWAGLIARLNQELGFPAGYLTPRLYRTGIRETFHDITKGNNGTHYRARPGWDACTGWGTPDGKRLLAALASNRSSREIPVKKQHGKNRMRKNQD